MGFSALDFSAVLARDAVDGDFTFSAEILAPGVLSLFAPDVLPSFLVEDLPGPFVAPLAEDGVLVSEGVLPLLGVLALVAAGDFVADFLPVDCTGDRLLVAVVGVAFEESALLFVEGFWPLCCRGDWVLTAGEGRSTGGGVDETLETMLLLVSTGVIVASTCTEFAAELEDARLRLLLLGVFVLLLTFPPLLLLLGVRTDGVFTVPVATVVSS